MSVGIFQEREVFFQMNIKRERLHIVIAGLIIGVMGLVSPSLATLASVPLPLVLVPVLFASFYANIRDVFGLPGDKASAALPPPTDFRNGA